MPSTTRPDLTALLNQAVDKALDVADSLAERRVTALRRSEPTATPARLIELLERDFTRAVVVTGAGTGALAAVPGAGLPVALAVAGGDIVAFMTAAAAHALAVARIHGADVRGREYQRTLLLGVLLGSNGAKVVLNSAGRAGMRWGRLLGETVPVMVLKEVNERLGGLLLRRFGPRAGIVGALKVAPLGIGAVIGGLGNAALAREVVQATRGAFGAAPTSFAAADAS